MALLREQEWKKRETDRQNLYSRDNEIEKRERKMLSIQMSLSLDILE